jgi:hypothetical protein
VFCERKHRGGQYMFFDHTWDGNILEQLSGKGLENAAFDTV